MVLGDESLFGCLVYVVFCFFLLYSKWNTLSLLNMVNLLNNKAGTTLNELWIELLEVCVLTKLPV
jgi:hypothetical protein